jgi:DNA repair protein RadC
VTGYKVQKYRVRLVKDGAARVVARPSIAGASSAVEVFRAVLSGLPHEEVWLALTNARLDVTGLVRVSQGGLHGAALKPSDVLRPVLASGASGFVMAHNHPSGDPAPSGDDLSMTRALLRACAVVGVSCMDHLILTDSGDWQSLADSHTELGW